MTAAHHFIGSKLNRLSAHFPYLSQAIRLVWAAAPRHATLWGLLVVGRGILPIALVYLTRGLVNTFVRAVQEGNPARAQHLILLMLAMAALVLIGEALRVVTGVVRSAQADLVQDHISGLLHRKSVAVDLAFYDNADFYDHLHRARSEGGYRPVALLDNLGVIGQSGITLISMLAVLSAFSVWLPLALVASTAPALYVVMRHALDAHYWRMRTTSDERHSWYYDWLLTSAEAASEIRLFGMGSIFDRAFQDLRTRLRTEHFKLLRSQAWSEVLASICGYSAAGVALVWMAWRAMRHQITLGDLALLYQAFQQGMGLSRSLLDNVGQLYSNTLFLGNLFQFLGLPSRIAKADAPKDILKITEAIRFRRVSFRYPGTDRFALRSLDLQIPANRITAIVGTNGAGKSTLMKLLCRFYDPEEGTIEVDGTDLRQFDLEALRQALTVVFQQPVHFNATVAENILFGDLSGNRDRSDVQKAARAAGAAQEIEKLPSGYDQLLGRWFEHGTELSAGEWQKIALARAFLRAAPILILDEPTSAMDPWAESDWLHRFRQLAVGRTAIMITHRFTTAMIADRIHVLDEGQIVESGSHQQLLEKGGLYSQGWAAQR